MKRGYYYWPAEDACTQVSDGSCGDQYHGSYVCPHCLREIAVYSTYGPEIKMYPHNSRPGEKCKGSGVDLFRLCRDCRMDCCQEYYMLHNELWERAAGKDAWGMLCVGCVEERLGRRLRPDDFADAPINNEFALDASERLLDRLGRGTTT